MKSMVMGIGCATQCVWGPRDSFLGFGGVGVNPERDLTIVRPCPR